MQTKIGNELYVTKFFYGKHKNPSNGKWRNRSTTCKIFKLNSPGKIVNENSEKGIVQTFFDVVRGNVSESNVTKIPADMTLLSEGKVHNCHGEPFVRSIGRKLAFMKALNVPVFESVKDVFVESFETQCPSSKEKIVELVRQKETQE